MRRRTLLTSAAASLLPAPAIAQPMRTSVLRFTPQSNLVSLDPIWTTATVTANHGYYVYDTLYAVNGKLQPKPQMAEGHDTSADGRGCGTACASMTEHRFAPSIASPTSNASRRRTSSADCWARWSIAGWPSMIGQSSFG
jgi:hypothetical protein